ncbi:tyrosine recombinase XerS [Streptococcus infantarius]|uniref:tyrosine recombinase XerS n=1 Tax=Streptococcus infantarius TaxID=102684 RepID=UPI00208E5227|nr:tyrosine recombinase XerS [Streptococcus infantarius]MCO4465775.1 tyrosine recombinase XerC [Streptococcus infantarius subsp. infantarius]MCO4493394.1 tyrosine recombinase XerC [Streptococcus infantarius subsp. infantarius]MCO4500361.1 tyrosine recombinase XerC [Streptococcus infantarius subsp. infantarius]MCO4501385.1 tyrosine recombinase XerC [Streptococcus infantarius subsp. infantarius]MCY7237807.1 tyrosine recombinase XerS [Streptococcus infantarius]
MKREKLLKKIDELKNIMPWYVLDYYQSKLSVPYSFTTLYEYLKEYRRFFEWILDSGISNANQIADIELGTLEHLSKKDMESFVLYLRERPSLNTYSTKQGVSQTTINRTLSALSSLFKYLTEEVEDENGDPYFYRNVMKKISTKKKKETLAARAENIKGKLFLGDETMAFIEYIDKEYQNKLSHRALSSFQKNKERDLAIISLLLASGVRLSEAVNLDLKDLHLNMMVIEITRKGGKRDSVNVAAFAKPYLEDYLKIRAPRYKAEKQDQALFLTEYRGVPNRIDASSIEKLVAKYSQDFKVRVTPHKLRHTLATRLYGATKSQVLVSHQLGHASTQVTDLYTHIVNDEQKNALDKL